jgi:hypothetical protein
VVVCYDHPVFSHDETACTTDLLAIFVIGVENNDAVFVFIEMLAIGKAVLKIKQDEAMKK